MSFFKKLFSRGKEEAVPVVEVIEEVATTPVVEETVAEESIEAQSTVVAEPDIIEPTETVTPAIEVEKPQFVTPTPVVEKPKEGGFFSKIFSSREKEEDLDKGLEKTKEGFFSKISKAIAGKSTIDIDVLDEVENILISSDVGLETTVKIIDRIDSVERLDTVEPCAAAF